MQKNIALMSIDLQIRDGRYSIISAKLLRQNLKEPFFSRLLLEAIIYAFESCKPKHAESTFIKFRSWNTLFSDKILERFPKTEWVFVHRNGFEILESVLHDPPGWLRSRHTCETFLSPYLDLSLNELKQSADDEYIIRVLGTFCKMALEQISHRALYVDYDQIVGNLPEILGNAWRLNLSAPEKEIMFSRTTIYSKDPERTLKFGPDGGRKRQSASDMERKLAKKYIEIQCAEMNR